MTKASKIGLAMMSLGFLVWIVPALHYRYPTRVPLSVRLPLRQGATLQEQFTVRGSQTYDAFLRCTEVGEFKEKWKDFLNWKEHPKIPCAIDFRILRDGREMHSAHLKSLEPAIQSGNQVFWQLAYVPLSSGMYELQLTNGTDLTPLNDTQPTVEVTLSSVFIKDWGLNAMLAGIVGGTILLIGIVAFITSRFTRKRAANQRAGGKGGIALQLHSLRSWPALPQHHR